MNHTHWLLTTSERANPQTRIDAGHPGEQAWSIGNHVRPLIHGASYFAELAERISQTGPGDLILFTDWRGDPDERLIGVPGSEVVALLGGADERGVDVRGLVWRSHWDILHFSAAENRHLGKALQDHGAEVLLDMRVRTGGSHHQKLVVIRHRDDPARDIAYVGGIDLGHTRRDDAEHRGDPQVQRMAAEYGRRPAWHDVQVAITGPAVHDVETVFRERWEDPTPLTRHPVYRVADRLRGMDTHPDPLPPQNDPPPPVPGGTHTVQLLRTYPNLRHGRDYPFARGGERSVARGYTKALDRARELVYIEDQYLWSHDVADHFVECLKNTPSLHLMAVLPRVPDQEGFFSRVPQLLGRKRAMEAMMKVAPDRVAFYSLENHWRTPVYVHAKVCVMDDVWASVGSDNFNRRSWTHDSEVSCVVMDDAGEDHSSYARRLRLTLAAEHLDRRVPGSRFPGDTGPLMTGHVPADIDDAPLASVMADCVDPLGMFNAYVRAADALDAWHDGGRLGPRPPGRLRRLPLPDLGPLTRAAAVVPYRTLHDPDGRPKPLKRENGY